MAEVVAIDLVPGRAFVDELQRCWESGAAALPIDQRLPGPAKAQLLAAMAPTSIIDEAGKRALSGGRATEAGDALIVATSGSTGTPKGVVLTHGAVAAAAEITSAAVNADAIADRWLACLPLAHVGGLGVVTRALHTGTPLDVHAGFDPEAVTEAARNGATLVSLVATAMRRIDTSAFRCIVLGGSAIPPDRPPNSVATYGMTETMGGVIYDGLALPGVEMRIAANGEIELRTPTALRCYRDGTNPKDRDGWYRTGDAGAIDGDVISVHGRVGDMIISGGENVWPAAVERILSTHPSIEAVLVVGREDPEWGQAVTAVVEAANGANAPSLDELRDLVKAELPAHCAPRKLEVVAALQRTAIGKVRRT